NRPGLRNSGRLGQPCRGSYVFKGSVASIAIEDIAVHAPDKQVLPSIVVVVTCRYTGGETVSAHSGCQRDVREGSVAVIAIEPVVVLRIGLIQLWLACPVDKVN